VARDPRPNFCESADAAQKQVSLLLEQKLSRLCIFFGRLISDLFGEVVNCRYLGPGANYKERDTGLVSK
jgi:hypothetical protein